jgi:hypothetical protein
LMTMPLPRTFTSVFAVPKSIAMSRENRPKSQFIGLKAKGGSSMRVSKQEDLLRYYTQQFVSTYLTRGLTYKAS